MNVRVRYCRRLLSLAAAALVGFVVAEAPAQQVDVQEITLDNGMTFLLVPRDDQPLNVAAGWVAKVGSANERPGLTGISHFFEHMMFKGTDTIGTRDPEGDADFRARQKSLRDRINRIVWSDQYKRYFAGDIPDPWDAASDTEELAALRAELRQLMEDQKSVVVNNEFDKVYTENGASQMNAFTSYDMTFYIINVPSNKVELWAWMESDRLMNSVFREFYSERDVVHEERRMRTESTPTGIFQEQFNAMFWQSSSYAWPIIGWASDINSYTMDAAQEFYKTYYQPANLTGILVGDFDVTEARSLIETYFGRIPAGSGEIPPVTTLEVEQLAEMRMYAECDCPPSVEIRYHTVPYAHRDAPALSLLADVLNGSTGRLDDTLVEELELATGAFASGGGLGEPAKYAGMFSISAEAKGDVDPEEVEGAIYTILDDIRNNPIPEEELQKVKNQATANTYRSLQSNFFLMIQLGVFEAMGDWNYINTRPQQIQQVTADDIQRVANTYFKPTNRSVAVYRRKAGSEPMDPELEAMDAQARAGVLQMLARLKQSTDPAEVRQMLSAMRGQLDQLNQAPPEAQAQFRPAITYLIKKVEEHLQHLETAAE